MNKEAGGDSNKVIRFPEDDSVFEELHARLIDEMKPQGDREIVLVERIARSWSDLQRARQRETLTIEAHIDEIKRSSPEPIDNERALAMVFLHHIDELEALQRAEKAIEDLWYRSRHSLEREQKLRRKRERAAPVKRPAPKSGIHIVRKKRPS